MGINLVYGPFPLFEEEIYDRYCGNINQKFPPEREEIIKRRHYNECNIYFAFLQKE